MTSAQKALERFFKQTGWLVKDLARVSSVQETAISHVRRGDRDAFSIETARKLSRVNRKLLPLHELLGIPKRELYPEPDAGSES